MTLIKLKDTFRKRFIAAESDSLVIETIQTESKTRRQRLRVLRLKGTWRANEQNELCFEVALRKGPPETYTFKGVWKINKNQQIEYSCGEGPDVLTFQGHWDISSSNRITYILEGSSSSRFEFKVQLESASFYPKEGQIRYRIGIGLKKSRLTAPGETIILYGNWKFGRNFGLFFQMDYGGGRIKEIELGADVTFGKNKIIFALKDKTGKPLGATLTMTRKILESLDAEIFVRLKSRQKEKSIEAGVSIPF
jgi:hypothetical protein